MTEELKRHLDEAVTLINFAHALLRPALPMLERFEREAQRFASIGAIVDPSLYRRALSEPWREDAREAFAAATTFVRTMNGIAERFAARASEGGEEP